MIGAVLSKALESGIVEGLKQSSFDMPKFFKSEAPCSVVKGFKEADLPLGSIDNHSVSEIKCRNSNLEGKSHPETGVTFEKKVIETKDGDVEVTVPKFESTFDVQLPEELLEASDKKQFDACNSQLKESVENSSELRGKFDSEQIEQIKEKDTPDGYTWHHDAETGKMQLVDTEVHAKTGHTGGKSIWGGGSEHR